MPKNIIKFPSYRSHRLEDRADDKQFEKELKLGIYRNWLNVIGFSILMILLTTGIFYVTFVHVPNFINSLFF